MMYSELLSLSDGQKAEKPLPEYLKAVKDTIRGFKDNREYLNNMIEKEEKRIDEKLAEYSDDPWNEWVINKLKEEKAETAFRLCEEHGGDVSIHIIYRDGSECITSGAEIIGGITTPKMQHIAYATYSDGWCEYDTLTGDLVDNDTNFFGDLSTEEGAEARERYYNMVEVKYNTEWGRKHNEELQSN